MEISIFVLVYRSVDRQKKYRDAPIRRCIVPALLMYYINSRLRRKKWIFLSLFVKKIDDFFVKITRFERGPPPFSFWKSKLMVEPPTLVHYIDLVILSNLVFCCLECFSLICHGFDLYTALKVGNSWNLHHLTFTLPSVRSRPLTLWTDVFNLFYCHGNQNLFNISPEIDTCVNIIPARFGLPESQRTLLRFASAKST
jgi:hypothetical protein